MLLTQDETAQRWCPLARLVPFPTQAGGSGNRFETSTRKIQWPRAVGCIGSRCMMWRWADSQRDSTAESAYVQELGKIRVEQTGEASEPETQARRGYCGLAGKPEFRS